MAEGGFINKSLLTVQCYQEAFLQQLRVRTFDLWSFTPLMCLSVCVCVCVSILHLIHVCAHIFDRGMALK